MTPKEKAIELVEKFAIITDDYHRPSKQCALIAVDEILETTKTTYDRPDFQGVVYDSFWQEVKQEIEKL